MMCLKILHQESKLLVMVAIIFIVTILISSTFATYVPDTIYSVYGKNQVAELSRHYNPDYIALKKTKAYQVNYEGLAFYLINNIGVGLKIFIAGLLIGIGSLVLLVYSGVSIGFFMGYLIAIGYGDTLWPAIISHSVFELTATLLAAFAGILIGKSLVMPGNTSRFRALIRSSKQVLPILIVMVLLYVIAGFVEAFWSTNVHIANTYKYIFGSVFWMLLPGYFFICIYSKSKSDIN